MPKIDISEYALATQSVRGGTVRTAEGEHSEPIFPTSSFVFDSAEQAAARFGGDEPGNIYSRFTNPTVRVFEERLAAMEGAERCVATSSGMGAITTLCLSILKSGDHIVASRSIFGTTVGLFDNIFSKFGITTTFVELTDYEAWQNAITDQTKLLFVETPSNPLTEIVDIKRLAEIAHDRNCQLIVDNCFCTPALQKPFQLGADFVIHSATKYLDGQGRCVGGAVLGPEKIIGEEVFGFVRTAGTSMSPFNAWVFLKGLETLSIRMKAHCENAENLANWLDQQAGVSQVHFPGLKSHPQHELAKTQQNGSGGVLSFELEGGQSAAWNLINSTQIFSITANLGDTKSTITHPATTTHHRLTDDQKKAAGITSGLVRISVGLEDTDDLKSDLNRGLTK